MKAIIWSRQEQIEQGVIFGPAYAGCDYALILRTDAWCLEVPFNSQADLPRALEIAAMRLRKHLA